MLPTKFGPVKERVECVIAGVEDISVVTTVVVCPEVVAAAQLDRVLVTVTVLGTCNEGVNTTVESCRIGEMIVIVAVVTVPWHWAATERSAHVLMVTLLSKVLSVVLVSVRVL